MATATLSPGVPPEDPPPSAASAPDATADGAVSATSTPSHSLATPTEFLEHLHPELTDDEEAAAAAFLDVVNPWRYSRGYEPLSYPSAVKFLMARKFHVDRTLYLYQQVK